MEAIGLGLQAIGSAVGAWATAFGFIYVVDIFNFYGQRKKRRF